MTTMIRALRRGELATRPQLDPVLRRGAVVTVFAAAAVTFPGALDPTFAALSDAYLAVTVFVAGTMAVLLLVERVLGTSLAATLERFARWQVPAGALLGAFPGCGGAIIAVTQFTQGRLGFGALVATLIATMGDAMFLLLARDPAAALTVTAISVGLAVPFGYLLDAVHGPAFLRPRTRVAAAAQAGGPSARPLGVVERLWLLLAAPGLVVGILGAFQFDLDSQAPGSPALWLGVAGSLLAVVLWVVRGDESISGRGAAGEGRRGLRTIIGDTSFVTAWVVFAFVGYELLVLAGGVDLGSALAGWGALVPLLAILLGFVPGCGPQIVVTSLYLGGSLPFSAQLGNAIANDGDALFPALAVAPRAALAATLYSALPALLAAYGWHLLAGS